MTALTARAAGVGSVWVASPRPAIATLAAAALAGADGVLGHRRRPGDRRPRLRDGSHPRVRRRGRPGNAYVTAAKQCISDRSRIDMLAGPSEVLIIADDSADPALVAADLLAQAEHDDDAVPLLIATSAAFITRVENELLAQLETLPTAPNRATRPAERGRLRCQQPR